MKMEGTEQNLLVLYQIKNKLDLEIHVSLNVLVFPDVLRMRTYIDIEEEDKTHLGRFLNNVNSMSDFLSERQSPKRKKTKDVVYIKRHLHGFNICL